MLSYSCHTRQSTADQSQTRKIPNKRKLKISVLRSLKQEQHNCATPEPGEKEKLSYCLSPRLLRNFAPCSEKGRLKKTKSFSLSCVRQAQWTFNENGSCYNNNEVAFSAFSFRDAVEGLEWLWKHWGAGLRKTKRFLEKGNFMFFISWTRTGNACVFRPFLFHFSPPSLCAGSSVDGKRTIALTMIVNPFSFHCIHVRIVWMLDSQDAINAVSTADSSLGSMEWIWSTVSTVAVLWICRCHLRWLRKKTLKFWTF